MILFELGGHRAEARFIDCPSLGQSVPVRFTGGRIVVGDITSASGVTPEGIKLKEVLKFGVEQRLSVLVADLGGRFEAVPCAGHAPQPRDYGETVVRERHRLGVVIELWGQTDGSKAAISYALIPILLPDLLPDYRTEIDLAFPQGGYHYDPHIGLRTLFSDADDLKAYALLTFGIRLLSEAGGLQQSQSRQAQLWVHAYQYFCEAHDMIRKAALSKDPFGPNEKLWKQFADFSIELAVKAQSNAKRLAVATVVTAPPAGVELGICNVPTPPSDRKTP